MNHSRKIESLQSLRALGFVGVVSWHCNQTTKMGGWSVSLFIILSGFLMVYNYYNTEIDYTIRASYSFATKRIKKLYRLHILTLLAIIPYDLYSISTSEIIKFGVWEYIVKVISNIFLLQSWIPNEEIYFSCNGVSWYLSVMIFIYLLFPLILKRIKKLKSSQQAVMSITLYEIIYRVSPCRQFIPFL